MHSLQGAVAATGAATGAATETVTGAATVASTGSGTRAAIRSLGLHGQELHMAHIIFVWRLPVISSYSSLRSTDDFKVAQNSFQHIPRLRFYLSL